MAQASATSARGIAARSGVVVIVTGAVRGLGRAMALALLRNGARVVAADLADAKEEMQQLAAIAASEGLDQHLACVSCDVTLWRDCEGAVQSATARFGTVHGLVNNAAVGMQNIGNVLVGERKRFFEVDPDSWRNAFDTNVNGPFLMARAVTPRLVAQGWGRIVNIVTSSYTMTMQGFSPYGPSKAALEAATVIWSKDLAGTGVTVNALLPGGPANTRMIPLAEVPDRSTLIQPEVMMAPIVWLMSASSNEVNGRRIIASEWEAASLDRAAADEVGSPAGW